MSRNRRRGSESIEFALVFPMLLALVAGATDYGWYYSQHLGAVEAARTGARSAAATAEDSAHTACQVGEAAAVDALRAGGFPDASHDDVTVSVVADGPDADGDGDPDKVVYVAVDLPYERLWGLVVTPPDVRSAVVMRLEDQAQAGCAPL